jgi:hypothetical protein
MQHYPTKCILYVPEEFKHSECPTTNEETKYELSDLYLNRTRQVQDTKDSGLLFPLTSAHLSSISHSHLTPHFIHFAHNFTLF